MMIALAIMQNNIWPIYVLDGLFYLIPMLKSPSYLWCVRSSLLGGAQIVSGSNFLGSTSPMLLKCSLMEILTLGAQIPFQVMFFKFSSCKLVQLNCSFNPYYFYPPTTTLLSPGAAVIQLEIYHTQSIHSRSIARSFNTQVYWSVCLSVCRSVSLSVGQSSKNYKKNYKTLQNITKCYKTLQIPPLFQL